MEEQSLPSSRHAGLLMAGILGLLLLAGVMYVTGGQREEDSVAHMSRAVEPNALPAGHDVAGASDEKIPVSITPDDPVQGAEDAPVTIAIFSDFECPYCREFHTTTFPEIRRRHVDTGQARVVFKHFPLVNIHSGAQAAAAAAQCAHDQQAFWPYADRLFADTATSTEPGLIAHARELELEETTFTACLQGLVHADHIAADVREAIAAGVTATPSFIIGGVLVEGALSADNFSALIESSLAQTP